MGEMFCVKLCFRWEVFMSNLCFDGNVFLCLITFVFHVTTYIVHLLWP